MNLPLEKGDLSRRTADVRKIPKNGTSQRLHQTGAENRYIQVGRSLERRTRDGVSHPVRRTGRLERTPWMRG